jgi:type I restriction enzyme S subunit
MSARQYPQCKDSAVPWIGRLPSHWDTVPYKNLVSIQNGADHKSFEQAEGYPVIGSGGVFAYASEFMYEGDSVLLGRKGTVDKPLFVSGRFWTVDTMYWTKISPNVHPRFAYYTALTIPFAYYSTNTALPSMTKSVLHAHLVARPTESEQVAIVTFLDRETAKIDDLVEEQKRLIELLKEKRQAVISQAVTKGLDPSIPMKDSGVEWLGRVPAHWVVLPCRAIVSEQTAKNEGGNCRDYLSVMANVGVIPYAEKGDIGNKAPEDLSKCKLVAAGDIVINSMNYGIGSFGLSSLDGVCSPVYVILRPNQAVVATRFAFRLFAHRGFQTYAQSFGNGILAHRAAIGWDTLKAIGVPVPPIEEQLAILQTVDSQTEKFDSLIAAAESGVALLNERRSALISAAVTGKIDVRGLVLQYEAVPA